MQEQGGEGDYRRQNQGTYTERARRPPRKGTSRSWIRTSPKACTPTSLPLPTPDSNLAQRTEPGTKSRNSKTYLRCKPASCPLLSSWSRPGRRALHVSASLTDPGDLRGPRLAWVRCGDGLSAIFAGSCEIASPALLAAQSTYSPDAHSTKPT